MHCAPGATGIRGCRHQGPQKDKQPRMACHSNGGRRAVRGRCRTPPRTDVQANPASVRWIAAQRHSRWQLQCLLPKLHHTGRCHPWLTGSSGWRAACLSTWQPPRRGARRACAAAPRAPLLGCCGPAIGVDIQGTQRVCFRQRATCHSRPHCAPAPGCPWRPQAQRMPAANMRHGLPAPQASCHTAQRGCCPSLHLASPHSPGWPQCW